MEEEEEEIVFYNEYLPDYDGIAFGTLARTISSFRHFLYGEKSFGY